MSRRNEITRYGIGSFTNKVQFHDDFIGADATDLSPWVTTVGGTNDAITVLDSGTNGLLNILTGTADNDQAVAQLDGEAFKFRVGKKTSFGVANIKVDDASDCAFFVGLAITDTAPFGNDAANAVTDYAGFLWDGTDLFAVSGKDASTSWEFKQDTGLSMADGVFQKELYFEWDGSSKIRFYADGVLVATCSTAAYVCTDEDMTPTLVAQTIANGGAANVTVDYVFAEQDR